MNPISFTEEYTRFFKVLNSANYRYDWEYEDGLNDMRLSLDQFGYPMSTDIIDIDHIFEKIFYGSCYREVFIPKECPVIKIDNFGRYWTNYFILGEVKPWSTKNIKELISIGADISVHNYGLVEWALLNNFEIFYYLQELICNYSEELWTKIIEDLHDRNFL